MQCLYPKHFALLRYGYSDLLQIFDDLLKVHGM